MILDNLMVGYSTGRLQLFYHLQRAHLYTWLRLTNRRKMHWNSLYDTIWSILYHKECDYVGAGDEVTALVVAKGLALTVGQLWDASSGNELGFAGFCRKAHEGKKIGKLTLHALVEPGSVGEDAQIFPLSYQLHYFVG